MKDDDDDNDGCEHDDVVFEMLCIVFRSSFCSAIIDIEKCMPNDLFINN